MKKRNLITTKIVMPNIGEYYFILIRYISGNTYSIRPMLQRTPLFAPDMEIFFTFSAAKKAAVELKMKITHYKPEVGAQVAYISVMKWNKAAQDFESHLHLQIN